MTGIRIVLVISLLLMCGRAFSAEEISDDELKNIMGAQMGLMAASIDGLMQYAMANSGKNPEGCFDFDKKLHAYGKDITFQDVRFRCFKIQVDDAVTGQFHSLKLIRFCKEHKGHKGCNEMDADLRQQLFRQL